MATFEEGFLYPLILLLVGGVISIGLGTWLTHWLENRREKRETEVENHRKELEIKVELTSKMSEFMANAFGEALTATNRREVDLSDTEGQKVFENLNKWFGEVNIIRSKLRSYYGDAELAKGWFDYWTIVSQYYQATLNYFQKSPQHKENLKVQLKTIRDYFSQKEVEGLKFLDKEGKPIKPWENLTISYDENQWHNVYETLMAIGDEIIKDVLRRPIKVF